MPFRLLRKIFIWSAGLGVGLSTAYRNDTMRMLIDVLDDVAAGYGTPVIFRATALALGVAYATGFVLLFQLASCKRVLRLLVPVGRMALTNYLVQSAVGVWVFYGVGLGLGPGWRAAS